jgi:hypothetical protein
MKQTTKLFFILTIAAALAVQAQAQTSNLVTTLVMEFKSAQNLTTPVLPVGGQYFFIVTGRYGTSSDERGQTMSDSAYTTVITTNLDQAHNSNHLWQWNGSTTNRPTPDVYQKGHIYRFDFTGRGAAEVLTFTDADYKDNAGSLTFQLFQSESTTQTEPPIPSEPAIQPQPTVALLRAVRPSFSNLNLGKNYQLQVSSDLNTWTNQGATFSATNSSMAYPQYWDVDNWSQLFFRLQVAP